MAKEKIIQSVISFHYSSIIAHVQQETGSLEMKLLTPLPTSGFLCQNLIPHSHKSGVHVSFNGCQSSSHPPVLTESQNRLELYVLFSIAIDIEEFSINVYDVCPYVCGHKC